MFSEEDEQNELYTLTGQKPFDQGAEDYLLTGKEPTPAFKAGNGLPPAPPPQAMQPVIPPPVAATAPMAPTPQKYGLDQQMAVEQDILKRRGGFGANLANAGAGFADALMQGVARAGPSNFQQNLQGRLDKFDESRRGMMEKGMAGEASQRKTAMEAAQNDPNSPISKVAQRSYSPTLLKMGLTQDEIALMPASLIGQTTTQGLSLEEIRAKADETRALREQDFDYKNQMLKNTQRQQGLAEKNLGIDRQTKAQEKLAGRGIGATLAGMIPFTAGRAATKALEKTASGAEPPKLVSSQEEYNALPSGTPYVDANGKPGIKK